MAGVDRHSAFAVEVRSRRGSGWEARLVFEPRGNEVIFGTDHGKLSDGEEVL